MTKPWKQEAGGARLEAFIGAYGVKTSRFNSTADLIHAAALMYEIEVSENATVEQVATLIGSLSKNARSHLARKNLHLLASGLPARGDRAANITPEGLERMMAASAPVLVSGDKQDVDGPLDIDPAQLLRKVVSAVISAGHADILWEFPEVLAFFGARIPSIKEVEHLHGVDKRMFEAKARWPNANTSRL